MTRFEGDHHTSQNHYGQGDHRATHNQNGDHQRHGDHHFEHHHGFNGLQRLEFHGLQEMEKFMHMQQMKMQQEEQRMIDQGFLHPWNPFDNQEAPQQQEQHKGGGLGGLLKDGLKIAAGILL